MAWLRLLAKSVAAGLVFGAALIGAAAIVLLGT
jgi:hypothetical protein